MIYAYRYPILCTLLSILLLSLGWLPASANEQPAPQDIIPQTVDLTLAELAKRRAAIQADPSLLYPLVQHTVVPWFDFARITRSAMGPFWRKASTAQRTALTAAFQALLVRTYAQALLNYPNSKMRYLPVRIAKNGKKMLAPTQVVTQNNQTIPINYRLHRQANGRWLIYDVIVNGISLIANYRSTFKSLIRQGASQATERAARIPTGIEHLIRNLQAKNAALTQ